ncbi:MAG: hypothetical protein IKQ75_04755 [Bacteroidales bacterium]|nr:hypothetical protein [Bacteroidales bacterium]
MKKHSIPLMLLLFATVAFMLSFFSEGKWLNFCKIAAFALPTFATVVEFFLFEKSEKENTRKMKDIHDKQLSLYVSDETLVIKQGSV